MCYWKYAKEEELYILNSTKRAQKTHPFMTFHAVNKVYLKTIFYAPWEIPFLKMNLLESYPHIDGLIVVEANVTQVGEPREYIFERFLSDIPEQLRDKIIYVKADLRKNTVDCSKNNDGIQMHKNEDAIWDAFEDYIALKGNDIVISVDADEILFSRTYPRILELLQEYAALLLPLHQFFYRMNYLWQDYTVWAPKLAGRGPLAEPTSTSVAVYR